MSLTVVTLDTTESFEVGEHTVTVTTTSGGAVASADHGALTGLADDDHTQYHTDARGDARYAPIAHITDTNNPHAVTAAQVGADAAGTATAAVAAHNAIESAHNIAASTLTLTNKTLDDYSNNIHADAVHRHVKNSSGSIIGAGVPVMFDGYNAGEDAVEVVPADHTLGVAIGITEAAIGIGEFGLITIAGILEGIDTSDYAAGQILYVNGAGLLTNVEPTSGYSQPIAFVLRAKNNGALQVLAAYPKQNSADVRHSPTLTVADHINATSGNPHGVTKSDVGLGNVPNTDCTNAANISSGTIDLARLPQGALERQLDVADQTARYALTTVQVQNGDVVKQLDTGIMYRVVDDTQLNSSGGYSEFTAGIASQVNWSGVLDKPDPTITLTGDVTGSGTMTDLASVSITTAVGNDSHSHTHTTLPTDILVDTDVGVSVQGVLSEGAFVNGDKTKLNGIETGAEVNNISDANATDLTDSGDSTLHYHSADRARVNHTGTQLLSTISDAGTMAAQNAVSVAITGGTIDVESLTINAISETFAGVGTVFDSQVYDTSRDPDGGQWRNRCQHTSWYQEVVNTSAVYHGALATAPASPSEGDVYYNTGNSTWYKYIADNIAYVGEHYGDTNGWNATTRGIRAEFPAVAAVIVEASKVWIFDVTGSEPVLWIRFSTENGAYRLLADIGISGVTMSNAMLLSIGSYGVTRVGFVSDSGYRHRDSGVPAYNGFWLSNIANRNYGIDGASLSWSGALASYFIVSPASNGIAITQLPNAAINPDTGLPYNTIAVATDGNGTYSVSVIDEEAGAVYDVASDSTGTATSVAISSDYELIVTRSDGTVYIWDNIGLITADGVAPDTTITAAIGTTTLVEAA